MYRLTLYVLYGLVGAAVILSFFGILHANPVDLIIDTLGAIFAAEISNKILAKIFHASTNTESATITALILVLIMPTAFPMYFLFLLAACLLAMLSKYIVAIEKQHVFNPAAVAVLAIALVSNTSASWWIGTPVMLPFVLVGGLLLARKIQRKQMLGIFFATYFLLTGLFAFFQGGFLHVLPIWQAGILDSAVFFFGFIMFTEPLTSPNRSLLRNSYAVLVAILFVSPIFQLPFVLTPEMALCFGNIFSYFSSPKYRLILPLLTKKFSANTGVFAFSLPTQLAFLPGQYMEWTLPHEKTDDRGNRRYFSIASSPTEKELLLTVKFYEPSSSYKAKLQTLEKHDTILAASLEGDFVLPKNLQTPLVFLAGGVGIAPFRSMIKYLIDKRLQADITLFYANRTADEIVFQNVFTEAKRNGVKTIYTLTDTKKAPKNWQDETGRITEKMLEKYVKDLQNSIFYLSGPQNMVDSFADMLKKLHIPKSHIKQDFFPGYSEK